MQLRSCELIRDRAQSIKSISWLKTNSVLSIFLSWLSSFEYWDWISSWSSSSEWYSWGVTSFWIVFVLIRVPEYSNFHFKFQMSNINERTQRKFKLFSTLPSNTIIKILINLGQDCVIINFFEWSLRSSQLIFKFFKFGKAIVR